MSLLPARISAVLGPTNTGKTHYAIERMLSYRTGVIGLPLRLLARVAMESGRRGAAIRLLERCIAQAPDFILAHNDLADLYMKEDRFEDALASVDQALALDSELPHSWVFKGNVLSRAQRHDESLEAYDRALALSPGGRFAAVGAGAAVDRCQTEPGALRDVLRREEHVEAAVLVLGVEPHPLVHDLEQALVAAHLLSGLQAEQPIILADEPTANLDSESADHLMELFVELNRNHETTFVIATHDQRVMKYARRVIRMLDGKIAGDERPEQG